MELSEPPPQHSLGDLCVKTIADIIFSGNIEESQKLLEAFADISSEQQHGLFLSFLAQRSNESKFVNLGVLSLQNYALTPSEVNFTGCSNIAPLVLESLLLPPGQPCLPLRNLTLSSCGSLFCKSLLQRTEASLQALTQLDISGCTLSSTSCSDACAQLMRTSPFLESVNLSSSRGVDDSSVSPSSVPTCAPVNESVGKHGSDR